jgi:methionyl-tRNA formyltransferase
VSPLKIVFMGTPGFAVPTLKLVHAHHPILGVYTQPPRPAGRGYHLQLSDVHQVADALSLPVHTPLTLKDPQAQADLKALAPDLIIVVAYGLILPKAVLDIPKYGCLNVHGSLLPRWRGAAPIQRAIMAGDATTGVTIMQMDVGMDTGPMLAEKSIPISASSTTNSLLNELAVLGAQALLECLESYVAGTLVPTAQPAEGLTMAPKIDKAEMQADWEDAALLERKIRALGSVWFEYQGERIKILKAKAVAESHAYPVGHVIDNHLAIACHRGILHPLMVQRAGGKTQSTADFLHGHPIPAGTILKP